MFWKANRSNFSYFEVNGIKKLIRLFKKIEILFAYFKNESKKLKFTFKHTYFKNYVF